MIFFKYDGQIHRIIAVVPDLHSCNHDYIFSQERETNCQYLADLPTLDGDSLLKFPAYNHLRSHLDRYLINNIDSQIEKLDWNDTNKCTSHTLKFKNPEDHQRHGYGTIYCLDAHRVVVEFGGEGGSHEYTKQFSLMEFNEKFDWVPNDSIFSKEVESQISSILSEIDYANYRLITRKLLSLTRNILLKSVNRSRQNMFNSVLKTDVGKGLVAIVLHNILKRTNSDNPHLKQIIEEINIESYVLVSSGIFDKIFSKTSSQLSEINTPMSLETDSNCILEESYDQNIHSLRATL